jgi:hypothetical protein
MSDSNGDASLPTGAEMRARDRDKSGTDLDMQILNDNVIAAINASERLHMLAKKKLREQGLAPAASSGGGLGDVAAPRAEDDALARWAKAYAQSEEGRRVAALIGVRERKLLEGIARGWMPFLRERLAEAVAECLRDGGVWKKEVLYQPNQVVTSDGTLWVCRQPNSNAKPPGDSWRQLHRTIGRR